MAATSERHIPGNRAIKIALLVSHYLGFCGWYGGVLLDVESLAPFPAVAIASGVLLVLRELYREGLKWLLVGEGVCTWTKVLLLAAGLLVGRYEGIFLSAVLVLGILGSELPDRIRKGMLFRRIPR